MVIHRSNFPKNLGHVARGKVTSSSGKSFQISRNKEISSSGKTKKIYQTFEKRDYNTFVNPPIHTDVLLRYKDSKSKNLEYEASEDNLPYEVLSLRGELLYREDFV